MHRKTLVHVGFDGNDVVSNTLVIEQLRVVCTAHATAQVARHDVHPQAMQHTRHIDPASTRMVEHRATPEFVDRANFVERGEDIQCGIEGEAKNVGHG